MRIEPAEYERMKTWMGYMSSKVFPAHLRTPETDPVAALDQIAAKSRAKARSGLAMAIGDIIDFTSDWPAAKVIECNAELSKNGLPTLSEIQARFSKVVQRVIRRGQIKTDEEFYALRNAVEQPGVDEAALWPLLADYEAGQSTHG